MVHRIHALQLDHIYDVLNQRLSPARRLHTLGTSHIAIHLAFLWGADPNDTLMAALLHDVVKEHDHERLRLIIERALVTPEPEDYDFPSIWHAIAGAIVAREEFGASEAVCRAIRIHPTGDSEMTVMEKIIFLSDYIEPTRKYEGVTELRILAQENLNAAVNLTIRNKTEHVKKKGKKLHSRSLAAMHAAGIWANDAGKKR